MIRPVESSYQMSQTSSLSFCHQPTVWNRSYTFALLPLDVLVLLAAIRIAVCICTYLRDLTLHVSPTLVDSLHK
jgi:hypothetical protein